LAATAFHSEPQGTPREEVGDGDWQTGAEETS